MRYQYKREPLTQEEANRLANACQAHEEKLVIWTLLDAGLRVAACKVVQGSCLRIEAV